MDEAKSFSKDVTTLGGEKGVFQHMKTCEVSDHVTVMWLLATSFLLKGLKDSLKDKTPLLEDISLKANLLKEEDGEKPNGTKDTDSRSLTLNVI